LKENAYPHQNKKIILKLDIKDFFNSIDFELIYNALPSYIFPPSIKVLLIKLCTYDDYLPQGSPTSPMLSNLVLKSFDNYIGDYCFKRNINYTRYCDDLTFSGDFNPKILKNKVECFLETLGFNLNNPKNYKKKRRQEMYYLKKYGIESHLKKVKQSKEKYLISLKGRINYCLSISFNQELQNYLNILNKLI